MLPAVVDGYAGRSLPGRVATVVARQHRIVPGFPPRAVGARGLRTAAAWAGNGLVAERPFPTASMVELLMAEDLLHRVRAATASAADGFDQRLGLFGAADDAAVEQGWRCCVDGLRHVHSVGVVGHTVVVLLGEVPRRVGYDAVRAALTRAAAQVPPPRRS